MSVESTLQIWDPEENLMIWRKLRENWKLYFGLFIASLLGLFAFSLSVPLLVDYHQRQLTFKKLQLRDELALNKSVEAMRVCLFLTAPRPVVWSGSTYWICPAVRPSGRPAVRPSGEDLAPIDLLNS